MRILFVILTSFLVSASQISSAAQKHSNNSKAEQYINALISYPNFGRIYVEDGAADGSVTKREDPPEVVRDILKLRTKAIPLLIAHLDDTRLTSATFEGGLTRGTPIRVPVGHVCLDILMALIGGNRHVFETECGDDGLGACVKEGYYFRPDEYYPVTKNEYIARKSVRVVKANWQRAYRRGWLALHRPSHWTMSALPAGK